MPEVSRQAASEMVAIDGVHVDGGYSNAGGAPGHHAGAELVGLSPTEALRLTTRAET